MRRSRKERDRCWPLVGHKIIFCAKSQTNILISRETGYSRVASQGSSSPFLKAFEAVFPPSTDRPWVSENAFTKEINFNFISTLIKFGNIYIYIQWHWPAVSEAIRDRPGFIVYYKVHKVHKYRTSNGI